MPMFLTNLVAALSGLAFVARIAALLGPIAAFVPGAQILGIVGAIGKGIAKLIKWVWQGLEVILTHPVTLVVVAGVFLGGMSTGIGLSKERIRAINASLKASVQAHNKTKADLAAANKQLSEWSERYAEQETRAKAAKEAADKAVADALEKAKSAQSAAARRLRTGASGAEAGAAPQASGSGLFGLSPLRW